MKKNKLLLNEDTTRKFMKYANIGTLAEGFLDHMVEEAEAVEEELDESEELEESASIEETEELEEVSLGSLEEEEYMEDEEDLDDAAPELDAPEPEHGAAPVSDEEKVRELLDGVAALVKDVFDVDVGVEGGEPAADMPLDADPMDDMGDLDAAGEEEAEIDLEEEFDTAGISLEEETWTEDKVNEVTQRVAKRLLEMTKKS
jgi:hypothetical protein